MALDGLGTPRGNLKSPLQAQSFYRQHRIERLTAAVTRVDAAERRITCANGFVLIYDAALIATGGAPKRPKDGSLAVDANLSIADGLFAGGDVASFPLRGDGPAIRVEHGRAAEQHERVAALNMLGRGVRYEAVPVFWTIQYLKRLDYIGHAEDWDDVVMHGGIHRVLRQGWPRRRGRRPGPRPGHGDADRIVHDPAGLDPEALGPDPVAVLGWMAGH